MPEGTIVKALSGYYYVSPAAGGGQVRCRARGIFKKRGESPLVGDRVMFSETENGEGTVLEILPRKTMLIRPPMANADLAVLVFSVVQPDLNLILLDKFLVHIEHAGLDAIIVWTKTDLIPDGPEGERARRRMEEATKLYTSIGYDVFATSAPLGEGIEELADRLAGHLSVFAGQSGVGKSSLLNALIPGLQLQTSEISEKLGRGRHTTRHVELAELPGGGLIADTPGFSQLDFEELGIEEIADCFREFREYMNGCKFRGCTHIHEPGCAVVKALEQGEIAESRYEHYKDFLAERKEKPRRY
jgi:ribosome biogenesis GTPase